MVDYFGVANHLKEALAAYSEEDIEGALHSLKDEIPLLRDRHLRVIDVLQAHGMDDLDDTEEAVQALADERVRAEFMVKLKEFNRGLDDVLPRPEGLEFVNDVKRLAYINALARNRYKDTQELGRDIGNKVRKLIDDYVISLGIDPRIPPVQLTDAEPFWRELVTSANLEPENLDPTTAQRLLEATEEVVATIQQEIAIPDFWEPSHIPDQERLKQHLFSQLMMGDLVPTDQAEPTAERLFDLARSNHYKLVAS